MHYRPVAVLHPRGNLRQLARGVRGPEHAYVPLTRTAWLVAGAGIYGQPSALPGVKRAKSDARVDVVFKTYGPHVLGVGVGRQGLKLTGTW